MRQFSSNFGTLKILTWILSQEYHQPLQKSRHICRILLIWDAFPRRMQRFSILRQKTQNLAPTFNPDGMPSMRQDVLAKRPTEVEQFAGVVRRLAKKHGMPTPANDFFYEKIREIEANYNK